MKPNLLYALSSFNDLMRLAEQGDAKAQYSIAKMYIDGTGVGQNCEEAFIWYGKAAEKGHAKAQNNLGVMYQEGEGVAQDYTKAMSWYMKAAEQGYRQGDKPGLPVR